MSCVVPSMPMTTLRQRMGSRAMSENIPLWAYVEIIATCNFKCEHCFIAPCAEREDVMSLAQAELLFRKLSDAGTLSLLLTGGEIFSHRQFKEIYLSAKQHGFMIYLNSNGYLIGERWADFLAEWPPVIVSISLYGLSDERYQRVTGIPNAFRRVDRAVDLLLERGIRVELKCPALTLTVDELPRMKEYAKQRGIEFRYDPIITPQEKGDVKPMQLQLAPKEVLALDESMDPGMEAFAAFAKGFGRSTGDARVYTCGGGSIAMSVNVKGGIGTCLTSRQFVGNLFEQPFEEVWSMLRGKVTKKFADGHPCATCKFRTICAGCPATVEEATGLPEGYVQQYCKITHLRAHRIGLHPTGIPRTVTEGISSHVRTPFAAAARALPILSS